MRPRPNAGLCAALCLGVGLVAPAAQAAKNQAPIAPRTSYFDLDIAEGTVSWYCIEPFVDPEGGPLNYTFEKVPPGLHSVVYPTQICLEGRLGYDLTTPGKVKKHKWKVTAHDIGGRKKSVTLTLRVSDVNPAPEAGPTPVPLVLAVVDTPYQLYFASNVMIDLQGEPLTYLAYDLPAWLALDAPSRRLSGTPSALHVGSGTFRLCAADAVGRIGCREVPWTVSPANPPPRLRLPFPAPLTFWEYNASEPIPEYLNFDPGWYLEDPQGESFTVALVGGPAWLVEDPLAPGVFRGAPRTDAECGVWNATVIATDAGGSVAGFPLRIEANAINDRPRVLRHWADQNAPVDAPWSITLPADVFDDEEDGALPFEVAETPAWMVYDGASRRFSGTPDRLDGGVHVIRLGARDSAGAESEVAIQVRVPDQNLAPIAVAPPGPQQAERGEPFGLDASGVFADPEGDPLTFAVEGLPDWLAFDADTAQFSGTPTALTIRPHTLWLGATDAAGESTWIEVRIQVVAPGAVGVAVSGRILPQADAAMDWDVNDPDAPYRSNRYQGDAQRLLGAHAVVGGFLAATASGNPGETFGEIPDLYDVYRVTLTAGQVVALDLSDNAASGGYSQDIDLYLFDPNFAPVDASLWNGDREEVVAPADGEYLVVLDAAWGRGNYVLTIGAEPASGAAGVQASLANLEVVEGEAIVRLAPAARGGAPAKPRALSEIAASLGALELRGDPARALRAKLDLGRERRAVAGATVDWRGLLLADPRLGARAATLLATKRLARESGVARAEPNGVLRRRSLPDDPLYPRQWDMPAIGMPSAWEMTTGRTDVIVAVIDTGALFTHPDLAPNLIAGYDFISDPGRALDGDGIDPDAADPGDDHELGWSSFHGTHVAGTVGARGDDGVGIAGVAWNVKLMPLRVLGLGGGTWLDTAEAIRYAAGLPNASGTVPARRADVINMSLGGTGYSSELADAVLAARDAGVIVVASAGNSSDSTYGYPAAYPGVISVAATDRRGERSYYSTHNDRVDVAAPGGDARFDRDGDGHPDGVLSCLVDDTSGTQVATWEYYQGTSMAAPHVAGVAALMVGEDPALTPVEFESDLAAGLLTADSGGDGPTVRNDAYGYGQIDAPRAVLRARARAAHPLDAPLALPTPVALNFGWSQDERVLDVANAGTGAATLGVPAADQPWVTATPFTVDGDGFGRWIVSIDRSSLGEGDHVARIEFARAGLGPLVVPVLVRVLGPSNSAPDNGRHYVVLADPVTLETVAAAPVEAVAGEYLFRIEGVPPGEWLLFAGSDRDGDGMVCDAGEACGAAPDLATPVTVVVADTDVVVPDFTTAFRGEAATFGVAPALLKLAPNGVSRAPTR